MEVQFAGQTGAVIKHLRQRQMDLCQTGIQRRGPDTAEHSGPVDSTNSKSFSLLLLLRI